MKFIDDKRIHIPAKTEFVQRKYLNIQYAKGNERRQLDIYLPNTGIGPYPVIMDIYGGGWYFGNKSSYKLEPALKLLRRGFAVVSINYSLSYQQQFPIQVDEIKAAIRYIKANAGEYDLDPFNVALMGESAGAHYAALCATSSSCGKLEDKETWGNAQVTSEVQAVIAVYCPSNLGVLKEELDTLGLEPSFKEVGEADSMEGMLFGGRKPAEVPELVKLADPHTYVNKNCPPFLFFHGNQDQCIPILQSMTLATAIKQAAGLTRAEYHIIRGARHNLADFESEEIYNLEEKFLRKYLINP
ncbi:alpha/beta hydrolase fold domain-containing protein [Anaerocolumna sedimenticola]|uniref:Alpha/beta hydrolase fold domain-containing protein n=1 Tax=Anaerocolumna sedimenticola TaxID=2696063 RepID=A0A6P1TQ39_9FIRM|nr:alpha/beta hydrolase [Anaerocolumna sedimenticola]QHQ63094.1 alpha/beta hydrolase fold domain-containing protein [Anaerocolumna sedimenticola]